MLTVVATLFEPKSGAQKTKFSKKAKLLNSTLNATQANIKIRLVPLRAHIDQMARHTHRGHRELTLSLGQSYNSLHPEITTLNNYRRTKLVRYTTH